MGFVIAATDYEGLGTPGPHPWLVGLSEGRGVLDSVRAARRIPETGADHRFVAFGASQGGGAALFAGELAPDYAKELDLLGVVAAAPAAELDLLALPLGNLIGVAAFVVMGAFGFQAAYPYLPLDAILSSSVISQKEELESLCQLEIERRFRGISLDEILKGAPGTVDQWANVIAKNTPGSRKTPAPVLLVHGEEDRLIPPQITELLFQRLCNLEVEAERRLYPGIGHIEVLGASSADVLKWISERKAGREPLIEGRNTNCL
jgi:pimeloyl-ACP methyl ester carboxylesterase